VSEVTSDAAKSIEAIKARHQTSTLVKIATPARGSKRLSLWWVRDNQYGFRMINRRVPRYGHTSHPQGPPRTGDNPLTRRLELIR